MRFGILRERVVARQIADAALGALALGDVARDVDVALELRVGASRSSRAAIDTGMVWPLAVRSTVSRASGAELVEIEGAAVRLIDEAGERLAEQLGFGVAEQPLRGLVAALDDAVRRGHEHRIAQAVEHGVQIILGDGRLGAASAACARARAAARRARRAARRPAGACSRPRRCGRADLIRAEIGRDSCRAMNQAPIKPSANSGTVIPREHAAHAA